MNNATGLARAAEAMLRALGGTEVKLRCPTAAAKDDQARQLGLEAPITEDVAIAPVVVRENSEALELLIAPSSVAQYLQDRGQSAEQFFLSVLAVFHAGSELRIQSFASDQFAGEVYLYRIQLKAKS